MSDDSTKEIIPGSWRRIIRDEIWENESPKIKEYWVPISELQKLERELAEVTKQRDAAIAALETIASCDWVITLPDRMDAVREIARETLNKIKP